MRRWRYTLFVRSFMLLLIARFCIPLAVDYGPVVTLAVTAALLAAMCVEMGLAMSSQLGGKITFYNYLAPIILPWGYRIGRGKIAFYVGESWLRWTLMATAMIVLAARNSAPNATYHPGLVACLILFLSWVAVGEAAMRLITNLVTRANSNPLPPGSVWPIAAMIALILASVGLTLWGRTPGQLHLAMLLTAGPVALFCGGFGLMLLVFATCSRNMRWI